MKQSLQHPEIKMIYYYNPHGISGKSEIKIKMIKTCKIG